MLGQAKHLLFANEALEAVPVPLGVLIGHDVRDGANPVDTLGLRKQSLHQGCLAGQLVTKRVLAKTRGTTVSLGPIESLDGIDSGVFVQELDIGLTGGGVDTLHDDVDGLLVIVQDPGVAAHDGQNLTATGGLGDLIMKKDQQDMHGISMQGGGS